MPSTDLAVVQDRKAASKLIEAVDETLEMLGRKTRPQVYVYLERRFNLRREEIPARPEVFSRGLTSLFGSASKHLELNIAEKLYSKLGIRFEPMQNFMLVDYVAGLQDLE